MTVAAGSAHPIELRIYPLYYGPIGLLAWFAGRGGAVTAAILSALSWLVLNILAGLQFSSPMIWALNTAVHAGSFLFVGMLISSLRAAHASARQLSRIDARAVRPSDISARLGGDEFAVLLPELGDREAGTTMERVRATVAAAAPQSSGATASIGAVTFVEAPVELERLVQQADRLMYATRTDERNGVTREVVMADGAVHRTL